MVECRFLSRLESFNFKSLNNASLNEAAVLNELHTFLLNVNQLCLQIRKLYRSDSIAVCKFQDKQIPSDKIFRIRSKLEVFIDVFYGKLCKIKQTENFSRYFFLKAFVGKSLVDGQGGWGCAANGIWIWKSFLFAVFKPWMDFDPDPVGN